VKELATMRSGLSSVKSTRMPHGGIDAMIDDGCSNPINLRQDAIQ
jgi:hypothetical protein